ncbi:MAG: hypothetical protein PF447_03440 [Spirochaetaceae bacterium]|jgi:ribonuclease HII|nr:hypothetical protein [Spirochaetaceae bacterium]
MIQAGIDEAALGPMLGPYTAALCSFELKEPANLYDLLSALIKKEPWKDGLAVGDSKKIFSQVKGLEQLEKTLLPFISFNQALPENLLELWQRLGIPPALWEQEPAFYKQAKHLKLPLANEKEDLLEIKKKLKDLMESKDIKLNHLTAKIIPVPQFNETLQRIKNKAIFCQGIIGPLIEQAMNTSGDVDLRVDRQGGRRFYGEWLLQIFGGIPLRAAKELPQESVYVWGDKRISFSVGADSQYFETALASMTAKFMRETAMMLFNNHWKKAFPELKETAGYVQDGRRFIGDLKNLGVEDSQLKLLIREK